MPQGLFFQNLTSETVWLNVLYYDSSCGAANQLFRKQGWWGLSPGQTFQLWSADLRTLNQYAYYEAEFGPDVTVWGGNGNAWTEITDNAFDQCFLDQAGCNRWVDYQELNLGGLLGLTVQLGPKGGEVNLVPTYPHTDHSDHSDGGWFGGGGGS
jgi:hypothetical protein